MSARTEEKAQADTPVTKEDDEMEQAIALALRHNTDPDGSLGIISRALLDSRAALLMAEAKTSEERRLTKALAKVDALLDELGAPKSDDWDGLNVDLSRVGRIKRIAARQGAAPASSDLEAMRGALVDLERAALRMAQCWNRGDERGPGVTVAEVDEARQDVDRARRNARAAIKNAAAPVAAGAGAPYGYLWFDKNMHFRFNHVLPKEGVIGDVVPVYVAAPRSAAPHADTAPAVSDSAVAGQAHAAAAPSKGAPLVYDPNAYRSIRRDQTEAVVRAFGPDAVEVAEILDIFTAGLELHREYGRDMDLYKALEHLGQARFFLLRVPS